MTSTLLEVFDTRLYRQAVIMCGPDTSNRPRGGALVALRSTESLLGLDGDLAFHTPGHPRSAEATHLRLTPRAANEPHSFEGLSIVIQ